MAIIPKISVVLERIQKYAAPSVKNNEQIIAGKVIAGKCITDALERDCFNAMTSNSTKLIR